MKSVRSVARGIAGERELSVKLIKGVPETECEDKEGWEGALKEGRQARAPAKVRVPPIKPFY